MADYYSLDPLEQVYLEHYGILGMKWGVRRTPEELGHKPAGGKDYKAKKGIDPNAEEKRKNASKGGNVYTLGKKFKASVDTYKKKRQAEKDKAAKEKAEKEKAKLEAERAEILKNPQRLYEHRDMFTKDEIKAAMDNFELEKKLSDWAYKDRQRGQDAVKEVIGWIDTGANALQTGKKLYTQFAQLYNTFRAEGTEPLPIPGTRDKSEKDKEKEDKQQKQMAESLKNIEKLLSDQSKSNSNSNSDSGDNRDKEKNKSKKKK